MRFFGDVGQTMLFSMIWAYLEPTWTYLRQLGVSLGPTWPTWAQLGLLGHNLEPKLGLCGPNLGPTWGQLGQLGANLGSIIHDSYRIWIC